MQPAKILIALETLVKLLLEREKKARDGNAKILGEICPVKLLVATLIAVSDLHEYMLSGKFPVKLLLPMSSVCSRTSLEKSRVEMLPSREFTRKISFTRFVQLSKDGGIEPLRLFMWSCSC